MGDFDFVGICEAPDDAVMARYVLQLGGLGFVRTKTLKGGRGRAGATRWNLHEQRRRGSLAPRGRHQLRDWRKTRTAMSSPRGKAPRARAPRRKDEARGKMRRTATGKAKNGITAPAPTPRPDTGPNARAKPHAAGHARRPGDRRAAATARPRGEIQEAERWRCSCTTRRKHRTTPEKTEPRRRRSEAHATPSAHRNQKAPRLDQRPRCRPPDPTRQDGLTERAPRG